MREHRVRAAEKRKSLALSLLVFLISLAGLSAKLDCAPGVGTPGNGQTTVRQEGGVKRPVTVADAIQMTRIAGPGARNAYGGGLAADFVSFSPDSKRFALVVKRGKLKQNTTEYSILLYEIGKSLGQSHFKTLVSLESSSNREAINDITWLDDNETILFRGETIGEQSQLYLVKCSSGKIKRLTNQSSNVISYSVSKDTHQIAFVAEGRTVELITQSSLRKGFHPTSEVLSDLIQGHLREKDHETELFVATEGGRLAKPMQVRNRVDEKPVFLSPDGRSLVVVTNMTEKPALWSEYKDKGGLLQNVFRRKLPKGALTWMFRYELVDIKTGLSRVLLDAPISYYGSEVAWLADSQSIVLTGVYLPLDVSDSAERAAREKTPFPVEVKIATLEVTKIADHDLKLLGWDAQRHAWRFEARGESHGADRSPVEFYQKSAGRWERSNSGSGDADRPDIIAEQNINTPPRIVAVDSKTGQKTTLLDLNPQFKELAFATVKLLKWMDGSGHEVQGGLYLPPDFVPGRKYPLVIQTHGFDPGLFFIDGPFATAFAAQPLAGKGIVVLQVPGENDWNVMGTPQEAPRAMKIFENAIDYLDAQGIIDRNRVGLIGFSQTCFHVQYTLTHSKYHFAAVVIADGLDGGYFQYLAFANSAPYLTSYQEDTNGGSPFGEAFGQWMKSAPGFLLNRVQTPLRLQAIEPSSLLEEWEWWIGLTRLGKPVDLIYIPTGYHILQKPWDRMVSQQGDVDWFCFWLKGDEDPDPSKAEQYARWRELGKLQEQNDKKSAAGASTNSN